MCHLFTIHSSASSPLPLVIAQKLQRPVNKTCVPTGKLAYTMRNGTAHRLGWSNLRQMVNGAIKVIKSSDLLFQYVNFFKVMFRQGAV